MTTLAFTRATRHQIKLRAALIGPSGSGKTYTALTLAHHLGQRVALIDTEGNSASKYALPSGGTAPQDGFSFDVLALDTFAPQTYTAAIQAASAAGYDVLVIDSLSHAWMGKEGALEQVDRAAAREKNSYTAWRHVTPHHNGLVDTMLRCPMHLIVTMRSKTEYVLEEVERGGRKTQVPRKVGMAPVQRDGMEYEFDVVGDMDADNTLAISKTRCSALSGAVIQKPGKQLAETLRAWMEVGEPAVARPAPAAPAQAAAPAAPANGDGQMTPEQIARFQAAYEKLSAGHFEVWAAAMAAHGYTEDALATITGKAEAKDAIGKLTATCTELLDKAVAA